MFSAFVNEVVDITLDMRALEDIDNEGAVTRVAEGIELINQHIQGLACGVGAADDIGCRVNTVGNAYNVNEGLVNGGLRRRIPPFLVVPDVVVSCTGTDTVKLDIKSNSAVLCRMF